MNCFPPPPLESRSSSLSLGWWPSSTQISNLNEMIKTRRNRTAFIDYLGRTDRLVIRQSVPKRSDPSGARLRR